MKVNISQKANLNYKKCLKNNAYIIFLLYQTRWGNRIAFIK